MTLKPQPKTRKNTELLKIVNYRHHRVSFMSVVVKDMFCLTVHLLSKNTK